MPDSRNLPSSMCPSCENYEYRKGTSSPHHCSHAGSFTNSDKCGRNPDKDGTASSCGQFNR